MSSIRSMMSFFAGPKLKKADSHLGSSDLMVLEVPKKNALPHMGYIHTYMHACMHTHRLCSGTDVSHGPFVWTPLWDISGAMPITRVVGDQKILMVHACRISALLDHPNPLLPLL